MHRRAPTLYRTLLGTVLGASLLLVVPTLLLLVTLYMSGVIGGEAWVTSSNRGAVPQAFGTTALEGSACYDRLSRGETDGCTELWLAGGPDGSPQRRASRYGYYRNASAMPDTDRIGARTADLRAIRAALVATGDASGFVSMGDWAAQVVRRAPSDAVLVRDVTDVLLDRLKSGSAAEAELRTSDTDALIASTWRDVSGAGVAPEEEDHSPTRRTLTFPSPYAGYPAATGDGALFAAGKTVLPVFSAFHVSNGVPGLSGVQSFISVPTDVMLLYTNRAILGFLGLTCTLVAVLVVLLRRFADHHLAPLAALSRRVEALRQRQGDADGVIDLPPPDAPSVEVARLVQAVDGLEVQWARNRELAARLAEEQAAVHASTARSLAEKETLLKEIHHRVKNNLQIISSLLMLQRDQVKEPTQRQILVESVYRVRSMALIHQQLYGVESLSKIDLGSYAGELARALGGALAPRARLRIHTEGDTSLGIDQAVPVGLILNELLTNALKYGQHETHGPDEFQAVDIHISGIDGSLRVQVSDNGPGLPEGFDLARPRGLGLELVRTLTRQLRGVIQVNPHAGASFELLFAVQPHTS